MIISLFLSPIYIMIGQIKCYTWDFVRSSVDETSTRKWHSSIPINISFKDEGNNVCSDNTDLQSVKKRSVVERGIGEREFELLLIEGESLDGSDSTLPPTIIRQPLSLIVARAAIIEACCNPSFCLWLSDTVGFESCICSIVDVIIVVDGDDDDDDVKDDDDDDDEEVVSL